MLSLVQDGSYYFLFNCRIHLDCFPELDEYCEFVTSTISTFPTCCATLPHLVTPDNPTRPVNHNHGNHFRPPSFKCMCLFSISRNYSFIIHIITSDNSITNNTNTPHPPLTATILPIHTPRDPYHASNFLTIMMQIKSRIHSPQLAN